MSQFSPCTCALQKNRSNHMHPTDRYSKANSIYIFTPPLQETYLPEPPTPDPRLGPAKFV